MNFNFIWNNMLSDASGLVKGKRYYVTNRVGYFKGERNDVEKCAVVEFGKADDDGTPLDSNGVCWAYWYPFAGLVQDTKCVPYPHADNEWVGKKIRFMKRGVVASITAVCVDNRGEKDAVFVCGEWVLMDKFCKDCNWLEDDGSIGFPCGVLQYKLDCRWKKDKDYPTFSMKDGDITYSISMRGKRNIPMDNCYGEPIWMLWRIVPHKVDIDRTGLGISDPVLMYEDVRQRCEMCSGKTLPFCVSMAFDRMGK